MITSTTKKVGVTSILVLVLGAGALSWSFYQVELRGAQLEEEVRLAANNEALKRRAFESAQIVEATVNDREELNSFVLTEDESIGFLAEIETAAQEQGISFKTNRLDLVSKEGETFSKLTATFGFAGEKAVVFRLIDLFESLPYESVVTELNYKENEEGQLGGSISIEMNIATYDN